MMDRRTLLKLLAAASLAGVGQHSAAQRELRVVVVGAGIVGASIAYHLARAGAQVTVIDREGPASHASRGTFAWINATWAKQPRPYHTLNQQGLTGWHELQKTLGIAVRWQGSLEWFNTEQRQKKLAAQIAEQATWGERARMVGASELAALEPEVDFGEADTVAFSENDGAVDPVMATRLLLQAAREHGAIVRHPCKLSEVSLRSGKLESVETSLGTIKADKLVLATGADPQAAAHFAQSPLPQRSTPGIIGITEPLPRLLNRIVVAPGIHMHQRDDGRIVLGEQGGAPANDAHAERLAGRPNSFPNREVAAQHGARMLSIAQSFAPGIAGASMEKVFIGWRPMPLDGHPVLGVSRARPDVYLAVMHSGVSLAPVVGQLVAHELTQGIAVEQLAPYRPDRNFEFVKRY